jgi:hypothetical protein
MRASAPPARSTPSHPEQELRGRAASPRRRSRAPVPRHVGADSSARSQPSARADDSCKQRVEAVGERRAEPTRPAVVEAILSTRTRTTWIVASLSR